jgi:hypothetical protein
MAQTKKAFDEARIPFQKMTFSPDVPSTALGANEYNDGQNVETDVRGIRSTLGDQAILPDGCPGTPTFITGGFRAGQPGVVNNFYFVVATVEGYWWATNGEYAGSGGCWIDITPDVGPFITYTQATNITEAWNGTVPFFNDEANAPMFWPEVEGVQYPKLIMYSQAQPTTIHDVTYVDAVTQRVTFRYIFDTTGSDIAGTTLTIGTFVSGDIRIGAYITGTGVAAGTQLVRQLSNPTPGSYNGSTWQVSVSQTVSATAIEGHPYEAAPYGGGDIIVISNTNQFYDGEYTVVSSTINSVDYLAQPGSAWPTSRTDRGSIAAKYTWNYNPNWKSVYARFMRLYNTPNVGCILVAGGLTATNLDGTISQYPVTVQWSQAFGLNQAPVTWEPTVTNVANQLEIPLRGAVVDAFPTNGQLFLCSYWDTVVFSPLNYSTTSAPILGVKLVNQGRGLLTANCWANTDKLVYGIDARDIWVFNGQDFEGLGNQRVKNWFFDQLDPVYVDRVFMEVNTQKNQIEIYYPTTEATAGVPNKMLAYRYDLEIWNAPRDVNSATFACESPVWTANPLTEWPNVASVAVTGTGTGARFNINQQGSAYKAYANQGDIAAAGSGYVVGNNIKILGTLLGGATPANDCFITVLAINGTGGITDFSIPTGEANGSWDYNPGSRTVVYARGDASRRIVQKDIGYNFISDINGESLPIVSVFRRDNIKMLADYSGKLLVHRVMPEVVNLTQKGLPVNPTTQPNLVGSVSVKLEGANSVGQEPQATTALTMPTNTDYPWVQVNQNAHRVNSLEIRNSSKTSAWMCSATTWQFTQTEDDR